MSRTKVGVLRGGPSNEYDVSLKTGQTVLEHLPEDQYDARDIYIDQAGTWHLRGLPVEPVRTLENVDCVFNALHGSYGEDGTVQQLLDTFNVPYTGSRALASALSMNKLLTKERVEELGIPLAKHITMSRDIIEPEQVHDLFRSFPQPTVIKPVSSGSSVGVTLATTYQQFRDGLIDALEHADTVMVEEYIRGREATCGIVDGFRNVDFYALPPIEIVPTGERTFFDYDAKYAGESDEICPSTFPSDIKEMLGDYARRIHEHLDLRHYSRADFIVGKDKIYFLEVNTLPGLTPQSLVPKAVAAVGSTLPEFLDHLIRLALVRK